MRRRLVVLLLAAVALTGCADDPEAAPRPARATGSPVTAPTRYDRYVALGDSYTAAPLVPPTDTSTICLRSGVNYPALVARAMPGTHLTDVSCSGATTANTVEPQQGRTGTVPPQLGALRRGTDLVTIGLGGNDGRLFATMTMRCTKLAAADPTGRPCADALGADLPAALTQVHRNLVGVVRDVRTRAPHARVLLVGYPEIVPATGSCRDLPLATGDYAYARQVIEGLNRAVRGAAADTKAEYVDVWADTRGHSICAADPWINGRVTSAERALAYHPMAPEQQAVARAIVALLR